MNIKLYGTPMCSRCTTAKLMLEHRNIKYEFVNVDESETREIPYVEIDGKIYEGKEALQEIRKLK